MTDNIFDVRRNFDFVFCIDGTASMSPIIENVKNAVLNFPRQCVSAMKDYGAEMS